MISLVSGVRFSNQSENMYGSVSSLPCVYFCFCGTETSNGCRGKRRLCIRVLRHHRNTTSCSSDGICSLYRDEWAKDGRREAVGTQLAEWNDLGYPLFLLSLRLSFWVRGGTYFLHNRKNSTRT